MKINRIISIISVITLLFTLPVMASPDWSYDPKVEAILGSSEKTEKVKSDVVWDLLKYLNLMDITDDFNPDANITREVYVGAIASALGIEPSAMSGMFKNQDMIKVISGTKNITFEEAIVIALEAVGYKKIPVSFTEYQRLANERKLLRNLDYRAKERLSNREAIQLIYNVLTVPLCEVTSLGFGDESYSVTYDDNGIALLEKNYKLKLVTGVVTRVSGASTYKNAEKDESIIEIDKISYRSDAICDINLLGRKAAAFVNIEDEKLILINEDENDAYTFGEKEFKLESGNVLKDEDKKIKLNDNDIVVYNGAYLGKYSQYRNEVLTADEITVIKNETSLNSNTIIIWDFFHTVARMNVGTLSGNLSFSYGQILNGESGIELGENSNFDNWVIVEKDGEKAELSSIKEGCAVNVAVSKNNLGCKIIRVIVSDKTLKGRISEIASKNGKYYATVNNAEYVISSEYIQISGYPTGSISSEITYPQLGKDYSIYVSSDDMIVGLKESASELTWGYMTDIFTTTLFETEGQIRIFSDDGKFKEFNLAKKMTYYDDSNKNGIEVSPEKLEEKIKAAASNDGDIRKIVRYTLKNDGSLDSIYMPSRYADSEYPNDFVYTVNGNWYYGTKFFGTDYHFGTDKIVIFMVPDYANRNLDNAYRIASSLAVHSKPKMELYGSDRFGSCECGLQISSTAESMESMDSAPFIVKSITKTVNSNGEPVSKLNVYGRDGTSVSYICEDDELLSYGSVASTYSDTNWIKDVKFKDLKFGDGVQILINSTTGYISQFKLVFRAENWDIQPLWYKDYKGNICTTANETLEDIQGYFGFLEYSDMKIYDLTKSRISEFKTDGGVAVRIKESTDHGYAIRLLCDTRSQTIQRISEADIMPGDRCLIFRNYGGISSLCVYR